MLYDFVTSLTRRQKQLLLLVLDLLLIPGSLGLAVLIHPDGVRMISEGRAAFVFVAVLLGAGVVFARLLELPRIQLKAYEQQAILRTLIFAALIGVTGWLALPLLYAADLDGTIMVVFTMSFALISVTARLSLRHLLIATYRRGNSRVRVLIYGAGKTGVQLAAALKTDESVVAVAFVDDNPTLQKMMVEGLPVHTPARIEKLITQKSIDRVVLAMPSISRPKQAQLARRLTDLGCEVRTLPSFASLVGEGELIDRIQPIDPGTYLNRAGLEEDLSGLCDIYTGASVLITGAGGSIGSELSRQILACRPRRLVLLDASELSLYQVDRELRDLEAAAGTKIVSALVSVTDAAAVRSLMAEHEIEIVLHAAAYKHVPMVEQNRLSGLNNNVLGTRVVAEAARDLGASHFVLISTDKAVRPTNVMGASKRLAELVVQDLATRSEKTRFSMVRFGNVLGSSGSVIPLFQEQIARGGPITLTHAEVTRYFMTIGEAARLVLMAGTYTEGGEVFVLDMGTPVQIRELAKQMVERAGYSLRDKDNPDGDIEIVVTGLRPGEKLHEELLIGGALEGTGHPKILRAREEALSQLEVATALKSLSQAIETGNIGAGNEVLRRWVDGYRPISETRLETLGGVQG